MPGATNPGRAGVLTLLSVVALLAATSLDFAYLALRFGPEGDIGGSAWAMCDFRDAIYFPCRAVFSGVNPYDVGAYREHFGDRVGLNFPLYAPLIFVLFGPLSLLPYETAGWSFQLASYLFMLWACVLAVRWCGWQVNLTSICTMAAIVMWSEPGRTNLMTGQPTWILVVAAYLALAWSRQRPAWSGFALALASFKPTYLVGLAFFMLCRGDWRALVHGAGWTIVGNVAGLALMAANGISLVDLPAIAVANHAATVAVEASHPLLTSSRVDIPIFLAKVLGWSWQSWPVQLAPVIVLLVSGWMVGMESRGRDAHAPDGFATFVICLGSLFGIYHHVYDLLLLTLPCAAIFAASNPDWWELPRRTVMALRLCLAILILNVWWTGPVVRGATAIAATLPEQLQPFSHVCWFVAQAVNSATVAALWAALVACFFRYRRFCWNRGAARERQISPLAA